MRSLILPLSLLLGSIVPLLSQEAPAPVATPTVETSSNAATLYRQAFAAMRPLSEEENALLNAAVGRDALDTPTPIPTEQATKLLADFASALTLYREATRQQNCDWGLDYSAGPYLQFGHLSTLIALTKLTLLQERLDLQEGKTADALERIREALTASRQAGSQPPLFLEALVQRALEMLTVYTVACDLSKWDNDSLKSLAALIDRTPTLPDFAQSIQAERTHFISWFQKRVSQAQQENTPLSEEFLKQVSAEGSPDEIAKGIQQLDEDYASFASFLQHPFPDSLQRVNAYLEEITGENSRRILSADSPRALVSVYERSLSSTLRFAMLRTAIEIRLKGPDVAKTSSDPLTHQPFVYKSMDESKTFQLQFGHPINQESITLSIR